MLNITTESVHSEADGPRSAEKKSSLKQYVLEKLRSWVNSLLEAERDEFLGRGRHQPLDEEHDNYRNGYRPRRINFFGSLLLRDRLALPSCFRHALVGNAECIEALGMGEQIDAGLNAIRCNFGTVQQLLASLFSFRW